MHAIKNRMTPYSGERIYIEDQWRVYRVDKSVINIIDVGYESQKME